MSPTDESYLEELNGTELYFEVVGEEDAPTLLYLHGGPGYNSYSFRALMGELLEDYRVVYLDQRGAGRSASLAEETLDLDTLVADIEAVREFLGLERFTPLGHGFGALVALEYTRRYPQFVERVITVSPWLHLPDLALTLLQEAGRVSGKAAQDPRDEVLARTPEGKYPQVGAARVEAAFSLLNARDLLNALQFRDSASRLHLEFADAESQLVGGAEVQQALVLHGFWEFEYPPFLMELKRPVYVIAGEWDRTSYPEQVGWLQDLADAELTVLDAGHYPWLDDEEGFAAALREVMNG
ncbi:alpha/beta fold hydrolase [Deinococcus peraridilitoris]|uniref:Putative hydrolase or acyltransferase of alpha/beta superfamily n=1 Tax=Deinococcus peraridilitoris (strain DSM 19664 / LMG 22246 / CIP 109416 / KR-200) TaxID=937777 RepID=L0A4Z1_DEIPD|nr:alpha/beta hydrolase [Deinococcus peraridilitoris]AFZ68075.1 putative hydrolase or acyltransferase of alpha/beta superfamily [Deinococcus peraridilitoris DSM 19664]